MAAEATLMAHPRLSGVFSDLAGTLRFLAAGVAALLPQRYWGALWRLPIEAMALPSGIMTAGVGMVVGARSFLVYVQVAADAIAQQTLDAALKQASAPPGPGDITTFSMQVVSITAVFAFVLFTPMGWLTVYLTSSGVFRVIVASIGHPTGDPLLTGLDVFVRWARARRHAATALSRRTSEEGPDTTDRLFS